MKKLTQILDNKSNLLIKTTGDATVFEALKIMTEYNVSAILIMENDNLSGIFTERDYARKVILKGKSSKDTRLDEVMTPSPIVVTPNDTVDFCMEIMTERHIRHLPVIDANILIGMISIGDLVKFVIQDQKQTIKDLEKYINS